MAQCMARKEHNNVDIYDSFLIIVQIKDSKHNSFALFNEKEPISETVLSVWSQPVLQRNMFAFPFIMLNR